MTMSTTMTPTPPAITATKRRTPAGTLGDVFLWLAAIGGAICIVVVMAAVFFNVTLIMFKTGSMEPTIPTGSLAIVHKIPASEVAVGDIVTVDRPGQLPVTHRVTSVSGTGESRTLTLRGDANDTDDIAPYVVQDVRLTLFWIPGWASVVVWFSNPLVLGALTLGATGLVTWAFWPRDAGHGRRRADGRTANGTKVASGITTLLVAGALVVTAPAPAEAAEVETVVQSAYLELTSISDPDLLSSMTPNAPVTWQVGVDATPPEPGLVHLGIAASGALTAPGDMSVQIRVCTVRWVAGACSGAATTWLSTTDLAAAVANPTAYGAREVGSMNASSERWLLLTVTLTRAGAPPGDSASLRLQAWGAGGPLSAGPGSLAMTGADAGLFFPPALLAFAAIGGGVLIAAAARRREAGDD
jgi:signal peptidase